LSIELRLVKRHARGRATCAHNCDFSADAVAYGIVSTVLARSCAPRQRLSDLILRQNGQSLSLHNCGHFQTAARSVYIACERRAVRKVTAGIVEGLREDAPPRLARSHREARPKWGLPATFPVRHRTVLASTVWGRHAARSPVRQLQGMPPCRILKISS
jgi:hypothetical protein